MTTTEFSLPSSPDDFGVVLPSADLRRLNFTALEYDIITRAIVEYIRTYYPDSFNDFVVANGVTMVTEIIAEVVEKLALRGDMLFNEVFVSLARTEEAVVNHFALIGQRIRRQTPATTSVEISVEQPVFSDIYIEPGESFQFNGPDGSPVTYEVFRSPGDYTSRILLPAGKRAVIAHGVEGKFAGPVTVISPGGADQRFVITEKNILETPITVTVAGVEWRVLTEPLERHGATDQVVEVNFAGDTAIFRFGDDVTGASPASGDQIVFRFRTGGGIRGRIGVGQIDSNRSINPQPPISAAVPVRFRNISPSSGGEDKEALEKAKRRAPRDFAMARSIVTDSDYAQLASTFSHPVYGKVSKGIATIRTARNANLVEMYVLALGENGEPVLPSAGLKRGLVTYTSYLNVNTDTLEVLDGALKPVDIDMTVIISRNVDGTTVKQAVQDALDAFFDLDNWDMGQSLFVSKLIEAVEQVDGVSHVDLFQPVNNIMPTGELADPESEGVGLNQLIVSGQNQIRYFYEKSKR